MSANTGIQWTDATWNPVVGCTKVSQGCKNCYAKTLHDQRHKAYLEGKAVAQQYAKPFEHVQEMPQRLNQPLSWRKPKRVFVNSVSDLFHEDVSDAFLGRVFAVMEAAKRHTFQILTKRPRRMWELLSENPDVRDRWPLPNVWLGVSVENQKAACERIPLLIDTPAAVRFLSCEPLIGPVDLIPWLYDEFESTTAPDYDSPRPSSRGLSWVIVGGESGRHARLLDLEWVRDIVSACRGAGVATFVKQLGVMPFTRRSEFFGRGRARDSEADGWYHEFRDDHGGNPEEWPDDLRVREFPAEGALV